MLASAAPDRTLIEAIAAYKAQRYAEAEARVDERLRQVSNDAAALQLKALLARLRGDPRAAHAAAKASLAARPGHAPTIAIAKQIAQALTAAGEQARTRGDIDAAIADLRRALDLDSRIAPTWFALGLALQSREDYGEAADAFARALDLTPRDAKAMVNRGISLQQAGDLDGAWTCYRSAYQMDASTFAVISQALPAGDIGILILDLQALRDRLSG
jgi:tetratricopeptide (TPR) repeat protein